MTNAARSILLLGLGAAAATAVFATSLLRRPRPASAASQPPARTAPDGPDVDAELRALRRQVAALSHEVMTRQSGEVAPVAPAPVASPPPPPPSPQEQEARSLRRFELIERTLAGEAVDGPWAARTEQAIGEALALPLFAGSRLVAATCRATLCRIEAKHDSRAARTAFRERLPLKLPALPSGTLRLGAGGDRELETVMYFARDGHRVPRVDEPHAVETSGE